ncbi:hypothetical protein C0991_010701, partial [Blastosporella zonata]
MSSIADATRDSSPVVAFPTAKKGSASMLLTLNNYALDLERHEDDITEHNRKIKDLTDENTKLQAEVDDLKKRIKVQEQGLKKLEGRIGLIEEENERRAAVHSDRDDESGSEGERKHVFEAEIAAMEASESAYRDNTIK